MHTIAMMVANIGAALYRLNIQDRNPRSSHCGEKLPMVGLSVVVRSEMVLPANAAAPFTRRSYSPLLVVAASVAVSTRRFHSPFPFAVSIRRFHSPFPLALSPRRLHSPSPLAV